jgi:hypothetical protein
MPSMTYARTTGCSDIASSSIEKRSSQPESLVL